MSRWWLAPTLLLLGLTGFWLWQNNVRREAVRALPAQQRTELYRRTFEDVQSVCSPPRSGLEGYCRSQATLLLEFPECDAGCAELAHRSRGEPTR